MKMPFMHDDNVSGNILGGEKGISDAEVYSTMDRRPRAERLREEIEHREPLKDEIEN